MRTIIDVPEADIERLDQIKDAENVSRNILINRAIQLLLANYPAEPVDAFGLWQSSAQD